MPQIQSTQYLVISFSYKNIDIAMREKLHFDDDDTLLALQNIVGHSYGGSTQEGNIKEAILLSTCNRLEIYASVSIKDFRDESVTEWDNIKIAKKHILSVIEKIKNLNDLEKSAVIKMNQGAIYHIFSVASSLESLVVGETQITGQLKSAYKFSLSNNLCATNMTRLMTFAFKCAASVRNAVDISSNSTSVAGAAVSMGKEKLKSLGLDIKKVNALVIGTGEMGILATKHLLREGAHVTLINRSLEHAQKIVQEIAIDKKLDSNAIKVESYSNLQTLIDSATLLFSATGAPHTIITKDMIRANPNHRVWFDLAMPRDIESVEKCKELYGHNCGKNCCDNLEIYVIDDLQEIVDKNKTQREANAKNAYAIIDAYSADFFKWLQSLGVDPIIKQMRFLAKSSSQKELEKALKKGYITKENYQSIEKILHNAFNTFLHIPTLRLKEASEALNCGESTSGEALIDAVKSIFDINDEIR